MMRLAFLGTIGIGLAVASGAPAQTFPPGPSVRGSALPAALTKRTPEAVLKLYSNNTKNAWSGKGDSDATLDLCVASNTGRFRLQIVAQDQVQPATSSPLPYEIRFRDEAGLEQVKAIDSNGMVTFEGTSAGGNLCDHGPNAELDVRAQERDLLGAQAGRYLDRFTFSVSPL